MKLFQCINYFFNY